MVEPTVTIVTASLPGRQRMLDQAVRSVERQSVRCLHLWHVDTDREGPAAVRNRLLVDARTEFVGFLDDDDILYRRHVEVCLAALRDSGACVAYPWFRFVHPAGIYPRGEFLRIHRADGPVHAFGEPFDPAALDHANFVPVTVVARTACLRQVGGFPLPCSAEWPHDTCEEWGLWRRLVAAGHRFVHVPEVTWEYRVHGGNTSGRRST
jgi:glycosyltransferase involved in cell wall biosynthesis